MRLKQDFLYLMDNNCKAQYYIADSNLDKALNKTGKIPKTHLKLCQAGTQARSFVTKK